MAAVAVVVEAVATSVVEVRANNDIAIHNVIHYHAMVPYSWQHVIHGGMSYMGTWHAMTCAPLQGKPTRTGASHDQNESEGCGLQLRRSRQAAVFLRTFCVDILPGVDILRSGGQGGGERSGWADGCCVDGCCVCRQGRGALGQSSSGRVIHVESQKLAK